MVSMKKYFTIKTMGVNPKVLKKLLKYKNYKSIDDIVAASKNDSFLKKILDKITFKKVAVVGIAGGSAALIATEVEKYIYENSGCFLYVGSVKKCKVAELSCCQPKQSQNVPLCNGFQLHMNKCQGYNAQKTTDCCRFCDAKFYSLGLGETLNCSSPTISDALAHLSSNIISYPGNFLMKYGLLLLALIMFILFIFVIKS